MSIPNTFLICLACVGCELLRKFTAILELEPQTLRHAADNMHVIALLLCFASRTPPASNAAHSHFAVQLFALATRAVIYAKELRARRGAVPRYPWRTHTLSNHIFGENDAPRLSFAARGNLTEMRGHRRGQRSLVSARRRDQRPLELHKPYRAQAPTAMVT